MKTEVLIPDDVFEEAERLTEAMNRVVDDVGTEVDEFSLRAARGVLEHVDW